MFHQTALMNSIITIVVVIVVINVLSCTSAAQIMQKVALSGV